MRVAMLLVNNYEWDARVRRQAEALARRGDRVTVLALTDKPHERDRRVILNGVELIRLPITKFRGDSPARYLAYYSSFALRAAVELIKLDKVDVVQAHSMPELIVMCGLPKRLLGTSLILDIHDLSSRLFDAKFNRGFMTRLVKLSEMAAIGVSDVVITVHARYASIIRDEYCGRAAKNVQVVQNLPDRRIWRKRAFMSWGDAPVFGFHGTFSHRNGVTDLVTAFAQVRTTFPRAKLWLIGDGDARADITAAIQKEGIEDSVYVTPGYVPVGEVQELLGNVHIGVSPCRRDSFTEDAMPTKALEYVASNIPLVASDLPVLVDALPLRAMWNFPSGSVEGLANAMISAAADETESRSRALLASRSVQDWSVEEAAYLRIMDHLAARTAWRRQRFRLGGKGRGRLSRKQSPPAAPAPVDHRNVVR